MVKSSKKRFESRKNSFKTKNYEWACFQAQQAVEKGLKAIYIKKYKKLLKVHDLVLLSKKINAPRKIIILCSKINPAYLDARYPDISKSYTEEDSKEILNYALDVLKWIETNLSKN